MQRELCATSIEAATRLPVWGELEAPKPGLRCVVVLPVRNEAERLARCLAALASQQPLPSQNRLAGPDFEVLLLANNCEDDSVKIAQRHAERERRFRLHIVDVVLPSGSAHIGFVRRELMNEAWRRLAIATHAHPVIVSTDADTRVGPHWLATNLAEIDAGADVVGGRILIEDETPPSADALRCRRLDAVHSLLRCKISDLLDPDEANPWPNHHQHFGASLAVRAEAYARVGGVPPVRYLEDDALVQALQKADFRVRRSPRVRVITSGRLDGRADVGLSWQLRQWTVDEASDPEVEPVNAFLGALQAKADLRRWWRLNRVDAARQDAAECLLSRVAERLDMDIKALRRAANRVSSFGLLWAGLDETRREGLRRQGETAPRSEALPLLRAWLRRHRVATASA